jgi:hypothetical protein
MGLPLQSSVQESEEAQNHDREHHKPDTMNILRTADGQTCRSLENLVTYS